MQWLIGLETHVLFLVGVGLLLAATQVVILVLGALEQRRFGTVLLGTLITPMCTGFPNLMIGLFGAERLQGDLVLQLNIGNNLANTSLITGLLLLLAGPLTVQAGTGKSKAARKARTDQWGAFAALWAGTLLLWYLARDGAVTRTDGAWLTAFYVAYQLVSLRGRGKVPTKQRLGTARGLGILAALGVAAWVIQLAVNCLGEVTQRMAHLAPDRYMGLFLGLLTVVPESFLLLRLAARKGSLGLSGLVGDCLVSIPLVIGVSALAYPFATAPITEVTDAAARPFLALAGTMTALSLLALKKTPVPRKLGLLFIALYATVWVVT